MTQQTVFYNFSGGMESAAMLVVDRERIADTKAIVRWVDTGKQFDEAEASVQQIESILGLSIIRVPLLRSFDDFLFKQGPRGGYGILRKGIPECSLSMKRRPLMAHARTFPQPWEINLGFNAAEIDRGEDFIALNERPYCHWRFPLQEASPPVARAKTWEICEQSGFTILVEGYRRMGRWDCYFCPNQTDEQAGKVGIHYTAKAREWIAAERRKGHSFKPLPAQYYFEAANRGVTAEAVRSEREDGQKQLFACACFGGTDSVWEDDGVEIQIQEA